MRKTPKLKKQALRLAKREAWEVREASRAPARAQARLQQECFWTWPWGHIDRRGVCMVCGRRADI